MEEYLSSIELVMTFIFADNAKQILGFIRDLFCLDAMERIDSAESITAVLEELQEHLDYEQVCVAALQEIRQRMKDIFQSSIFWRSRRAQDYVELICQSMDMHSTRKDHLIDAFDIFQEISLMHISLPGDAGPSIVAAMQNFLHEPEIQVLGVRLLETGQVYDKSIVPVLEQVMDTYANKGSLVNDCFQVLDRIRAWGYPPAGRVMINFADTHQDIELDLSSKQYLRQAREAEN